MWAAAELLQGSAIDYYREIAPSLESWAHLRDLMRRRYHYLDDSDMAKQKLQNFTQRPNEPIPVYVERLETLAKQAYRQKLTESNVVENVTWTFINGILDRKLQERIATKRPKTLADAYHIAIDQQKLMTEVAMYRDHSKGEPMDCSAVTAAQRNDDLGEVKQLLKVLVEQQQRPYQVQPQHPQSYQQPEPQNRFVNTSRPPPRTAQPQRRPQVQNSNHDRNRAPANSGRDRNRTPYRWTTDNRPICHFCGNIGHMQRVCRQKQAAQSSSGQSFNSLSSKSSGNPPQHQPLN